MTTVSRPVPSARVVGQPADPAADFDQLYQVHFGRVLAAAYALTGDPQTAQDLTQEAFCRAWQRWSRIAAYDDPLAWVRRVVTNLANKRPRTRRTRAAVVGRRDRHRHHRPGRR
jgi:RNA polymerase sigma-70 factor, ECF subfamily